MYAKLFTSIYQGTLRGNAHGLLVFTNLLAHCDKHGEVDIHPRAIAEEVGLTVDQVRVALGMLEAPDCESRSPDLDGRRIVRLDQHRDWGWQVVNYLKYRSIRDEEDRREQNRLAQERWRNKNKPASATVDPDKPIQKQKHKHTNNPPNPPASPGGAFARFWESWPAHPRKVAREQCERKWASKGCDVIAEQVLAALEAAKASEAWAKDGGEFIPAPLVWLNQARWEAPTEQEAAIGDPWETALGVNSIAKHIGMPPWDECCEFRVFRARVRAEFDRKSGVAE
jgi:hypothetical protein